MTDPWPRFSPAWWAAWTFALHRPGRLDDEEIPDGLRDAAWPAWEHYPPWDDAHGHAVGAMDRRPWAEGAGPQNRSAAAPRPDWPTMLHAQCDGAPTPTDACALHGGRCSGACGGDEAARTARGRWWYVRTMRREGAGE